MIFPKQCKETGFASGKPLGDRVYFLSRYIVKETPFGYEVLEIEQKPGTGLLREVKSVKTLASADETYLYPERVVLHNRAELIRIAESTQKKCTIFTGIDDHMTFVIDPDTDSLLRVFVYDVMPPRPNLSETIKSLEKTGIFGELEIEFVHHIKDIKKIEADVYPCKASGFDVTLDSDRLSGGETVAGCLTARQFLAECYDGEFVVENICPADEAQKPENRTINEPWIARCCRIEKCGLVTDNTTGVVVHWGSSPKQIADSIFELLEEYKKR
ncbi:hypothetical protein F1737_00600 [Methanoplanus sp. FWC-SCC4]|uniref:Uncharacterized protein n=1 Tax=Methanochimaera problematica TaxID=2609417 RepID=A0AA97FAE9_9EURY|nr:hypothetical protein [Methanoplanus sp. FWC-SCC4]WOF15282.1 hypothetical protein F1737_00600 [Methanoplanus sp. FWC-SCC4]